MRGYVGLFWSVVVACALVAAASSAAEPAGTAGSGKPRWVMTDLGTLGGVASIARAINDEGQVVGTSRTARGERDVFLWQKGRMVDIGRYGWEDSVDVGAILLTNRGQVLWEERGRGAVMWEKGVTTRLPLDPSAVNDRGEIAGTITGRNGTGVRAALWQDGRLRDLGVLPGKIDSWAVAINDAGAVVGYSSGRSGARRAFIWENGRMRDLGVLAGGLTSCEPSAINNRGQVVGDCQNGTGPLHAFLWQRNRMRALGALPGFEASYANAIDERGWVVGESYNLGGLGHPFLWQNGTMIDLGTRGGGETGASAINDAGQIIGWSTSKTRTGGCFVWVSGVMTDLGRSGKGPSPCEADAINNHGQIVGTSATKTGQHAVLWTLKTGS